MPTCVWKTNVLYYNIISLFILFIQYIIIKDMHRFVLMYFLFKRDVEEGQIEWLFFFFLVIWSILKLGSPDEP